MAAKGSGERVASERQNVELRRSPRLLVAGSAAVALILIAVILGFTTSPHGAVVPQLVDSPLATAERSLSSSGLKWHVVHLPHGTPRLRQGIVLYQKPGAGSVVASGSRVQLSVLGTFGVDGPTVRTPELVGMVQWIAYNAIVDRGLTPVVVGPAHHGSGYEYWTIASQLPSAGTPLQVGVGRVTITMREPPAVHVSVRIDASACASAGAPGVRVVAAYTITSAQLRRPPISDTGPLSRQAPGSRWKLCYVIGPNADRGSGGGAPVHGTVPPSAPAPVVMPKKAIYVYYRNGSIAEIDGMSSFRFVVAQE